MWLDLWLPEGLLPSQSIKTAYERALFALEKDLQLTGTHILTTIYSLFTLSAVIFKSFLTQILGEEKGIYDETGTCK